MKLFLNFLFNLLLLSTFTSCLEENIPRNRPDLRIGQQGINVDNEENNDNEEETEEEEEQFTRPSNAVVLQADHCECESGQSIGLGNCANFCSTQGNNAQRTVFFNVELSQLITESNMRDLNGFCSIVEGDPANLPGNPGCQLEAKDEDGNIVPLPSFTFGAGQTSFNVDIGALPLNKTIRLTIVETLSGARSTSIQVRLRDINQPNTVAGLLTFMPVSEYTCISRGQIFDDDTGALIIDSASRFHFYFIDSTRPEPLRPETLSAIYCHDLEQSPSIPLSSPLLEERTGVFTVWNNTDPRFFDLDRNDSLDVNDIIKRNVELQGATLTATPNFFFPLDFPNGIDDGDADVGDDPNDGSNVSVQPASQSLGFAMSPFLDDRTFRSYCPTKQHYFSNNVIFEAMRDLIGVGTEAIYIAKQDNVRDCILVNETAIAPIRFFESNGQRIQPTPDTIRGKKIQFFWPADNSSPFIKKSHQRTYTIVPQAEINSQCGGSTDGAPQDSNGVRTDLPTHDNRIGCIPVLD